jgi:Flp pilus assembly protein TadB
VTDGGSSSGPRPRSWPYYAIGVAVGVGAAVAGVLIAAARPSSAEHRHGPVYVVVFAVVAAAVAGGLIIWRLRRQLNQPVMQRIRNFSFAQRRATIRAVNSGNTLDEDQRTVAQAQLELLDSTAVRLRWALPLAAVAFVVLAVMDVHGMRWIWAAIAALEMLSVVAAFLLFRRQGRRIRRALDKPASSAA